MKAEEVLALHDTFLASLNIEKGETRFIAPLTRVEMGAIALGLRALLWLADDSEWDADSGQSVGDYVAEGLDAKEAILAELEKLEARG